MERAVKFNYTTIMPVLLAFFTLVPGICNGGNAFEREFAGPDQNFVRWAEELVSESLKIQNIMKPENNQNQRKCSMHSTDDLDRQTLNYPKLMGFISFSIPMDTLLEISLHLQRVGGAFVIRGLPENSFKLLSEKIVELKKRGVNIPILIDPKAFELHKVEQVPTYVLFDGFKFDKIAGNISADAVLSAFAEKGDCEEAKNLLRTFRGQ